MRLGILVTTNRNRDAVVGLTKAALAKGHQVSIFNMDEGTKLLGDGAFNTLCKTEGVDMSFCDHSAEGMNVSKEGVPKEIVCGSQFNNANMMHEADKIINL